MVFRHSMAEEEVASVNKLEAVRPKKPTYKEVKEEIQEAAIGIRLLLQVEETPMHSFTVPKTSYY